MLLAAGANADLARNDGATSLWIASQMGHDHVVKVLLQKGANVDAVRCVSSCLIDWFHELDLIFIFFRMEQQLYSKQHIKDTLQLYKNSSSIVQC